MYSPQIETPSKSYFEGYGYDSIDGGQQESEEWFHSTVFLVALAAASIVIIIMVVAILCVKSQSYKYKGKKVELFSRARAAWRHTMNDAVTCVKNGC